MIEDVLARLDKVKPANGGYTARCPGHQDKVNSLSIHERDGKVLLNCHAGCRNEDLVRSMGLEWGDLFEPQEQRGEAPDASYVYTDSDGRPVYEVIRFPGKQFRQRKLFDDGTYEWGMRDVERVLYRLPEVLEARGKRKIFIVEGEKDVEALRKAGGVATCNVGGANSWRPEYVESLRGAHVVIVADKDEPGFKHANTVLESLDGVAASVRIVKAKTGKDAADHLAAGHGLDEFIPVGEPMVGLQLIRIDTVEPKQVDWVPGFENMVAFGAIGTLMGMPGVNKSTLANLIAARVTETGKGAVFISTEDLPEVQLRPRLELSGADMSKCFFLTKREEEDGPEGIVLLPNDVDALEKLVVDNGIGLVVIDPVAAHIDSDGNNDPEIRRALAPLGKMAARTKCAVLLVMHLNKGRSTNPMLRAGGSIGIPGISRTCLLMAEHPWEDEDLGNRVVIGFKNNWGPKPTTKIFHLSTVDTGIYLSAWGEHPVIEAQHVLDHWRAKDKGDF